MSNKRVKTLSSITTTVFTWMLTGQVTMVQPCMCAVLLNPLPQTDDYGVQVMYIIHPVRIIVSVNESEWVGGIKSFNNQCFLI